MSPSNGVFHRSRMASVLQWVGVGGRSMTSRNRLPGWLFVRMFWRCARSRAAILASLGSHMIRSVFGYEFVCASAASVFLSSAALTCLASSGSNVADSGTAGRLPCTSESHNIDSQPLDPSPHSVVTKWAMAVSSPCGGSAKVRASRCPLRLAADCTAGSSRRHCSYPLRALARRSVTFWSLRPRRPQ